MTKKLATVVVFGLFSMGLLTACQDKETLTELEAKLEQKKPEPSNQVLPTDALKALDQSLSGANKAVAAKDIKFNTVAFAYELPKAVMDVCQSATSTATQQDSCPKIDVELAKIEPLWVEQIVNRAMTGDDNPKLLKFKQTLDEFVSGDLLTVNHKQQNADEALTSASVHHWRIRPELLPAFNNVAQIKISQFVYTDLGVSRQRFLIFDMDFQSQITLGDVLKREQTANLYELAYASFREFLIKEFNLTKEKDVDNYQKGWQFELSDEFYFGEQGLVFVYHPLELGEEIAEFVELVVPYDKLGDVLKEPYLPRMPILP